MALELRPNCEMCDCDLPADSPEAMICTYECTFCCDCVKKLEDVCPNCGGGFCARPIRPKMAWREGVSLMHQPASTKRVHSPYDWAALKAHIARIRQILPRDR